MSSTGSERRMSADELGLLEQSHRAATTLHVVVNGCAHSCCGRGWRRRDGYEQHYYGYVSVLDTTGDVVTFSLTSLGVGTVSYVVAVREWEVELVERSGV